MENQVYVTGHKNPDTDSICSAIAYAELKRKMGTAATACRLGELNRETAFVLDHFEVPSPELLYNVKTQVSDLDMDVVNSVSPSVSIKSAWKIMKRNNVKTLPVVDDNGRLLGVVTLSDITNKYMDALDNNTIATSKTTLGNIVETLNARLIWGSQQDFATSGKILIAAMNADEMSPHVESGDVVIAGGRTDTQLKAVELGANCIIVTCGAKIDPSVVKAAEAKRCILMATQADTFTTARLINQSVPIGYIMSTENLVKFEIDDYIEDIKDKMLKTRYRSYPVVDSNNVIKGLISRYHLISYRNKKVILVDHNEKSQTVNGIEEAEILEIIDHHRLGDIQTSKPIWFKNEPLGSTSTIVASLYFESGIRPSRTIAGLLCAAIISDTIKFKSPTCTYTDRSTAEKLAEIAGIQMDEFALAMFKAGSTLLGKSPQEIVCQDFKEFRFGKYKVGIAQVYTIDSEGLNEIRGKLIEYMDNYCRNRGYSLVMLLVTDILDQGSEVLYTGEARELVAKAFNIELTDNSVYLDGVVSRKKQVIPFISRAAE